MKINKSKILVAILWMYFVISGVVQGYTLPTSRLAHDFPIPWKFLVVMPVIIIIGAFFTKEIPGEFSIGKRIDQKFGIDTYRAFMKMLKLELLFSSMFFGIGIVGIIRALQLDGPTGAFAISGFFLSGGISFLIAYFIGKKRYIYKIEPTTSQQFIPYTSTDAAGFWKEAKSRRNLFFAIWVGWLIAGPCLIWIYSFIFSAFDAGVRMFAALATWGAVWIWTSIRIKQLICFRCGKQAFSTAYFFMRHAKCRNCGVTPQDQNI